MVPQVNESSRCFVKWKFYDKAGTAQIPSALSYRVDCETTNTELLGWTALTSASSVEITIPATVNVIQRNNSAVERKVLTLRCNTGDDEFNETQKWDVVNLQGITS